MHSLVLKERQFTRLTGHGQSRPPTHRFRLSGGDAQRSSGTRKTELNTGHPKIGLGLVFELSAIKHLARSRRWYFRTLFISALLLCGNAWAQDGTKEYSQAASLEFSLREISLVVERLPLSKSDAESCKDDCIGSRQESGQKTRAELELMTHADKLKKEQEYAKRQGTKVTKLQNETKTAKERFSEAADDLRKLQSRLSIDQDKFKELKRQKPKPPPQQANKPKNEYELEQKAKAPDAQDQKEQEEKWMAQLRRLSSRIKQTEQQIREAKSILQQKRDALEQLNTERETTFKERMGDTGITLLEYYIKTNNREKINWLIDQRIAELGRTMSLEVVNASKNNDVDRLRHLISIGADLTGSDSSGYSGLAYARAFGFANIVGLLIQGGAALDVPWSLPVTTETALFASLGAQEEPQLIARLVARLNKIEESYSRVQLPHKSSKELICELKCRLQRYHPRLASTIER